MSLDGFIADADYRGDRLQMWLQAGDTPSRLNPAFTMSPESALFFDEGVGRCGAVISGRRTYDVSNAWGGKGPMGPLPLFVVTHSPPDRVPEGPLPYTFVTDRLERAVRLPPKCDDTGEPAANSVPGWTRLRRPEGPMPRTWSGYHWPSRIVLKDRPVPWSGAHTNAVNEGAG
jgi:hypothetical protein